MPTVLIFYAAISHHKLHSLKQSNLPSHSPGIQKSDPALTWLRSRCWQECIPLWRLDGRFYFLDHLGVGRIQFLALVGLRSLFLCWLSFGATFSSWRLLWSLHIALESQNQQRSVDSFTAVFRSTFHLCISDCIFHF